MQTLSASDVHITQARQDARVYLLGLDFGSTTSSALIASARLGKSATGHMQFTEIHMELRCEPVFTPWRTGGLDISRIAQLIQQWLQLSGIAPNQLFSGGSIITGLAAQAPNVSELRALIKHMIGDSVIATADDPSLESWLAFMGSAAALSRHHSSLPILNLDIGGGTTNAALGLHGDVLATGCYFIGARHFQFIAGTYQLCAVSSYGQALLGSLGIQKGLGASLSASELAQILAFYIAALEAIALNKKEFFSSASGQIHQQVALEHETGPSVQLTFSGGVGELLYRYSAGHDLPSTTYFGDLGIDLARAIAHSSILSANLNAYVPENQGRATVYGLTLHNTEISGSTLFLPQPQRLPLNDLAIVAKLSLHMPNSYWHKAFQLAAQQSSGACLQIIDFDTPSLDDVRKLAQQIQACYVHSDYPAQQALVILLSGNLGKALGQYCSNWGHSMANLIVLDEVPLRHAQFVHIGRLQQQMLAVSFFGMH